VTISPEIHVRERKRALHYNIHPRTVMQW